MDHAYFVMTWEMNPSDRTQWPIQVIRVARFTSSTSQPQSIWTLTRVKPLLFVVHQTAPDFVSPVQLMMGDFGECWAVLRQQIGDHIVLVEQVESLRLQLQPWIEEAGYLPLPEDCVMDCSWLLRVLVPENSDRKLGATVLHLGLSGDDGHGESHEMNELEALGCLSQWLLDRLTALPLYTLQTLTAATIDLPAMQKLFSSVLSSRMTDPVVHDDLSIKVLDGLAYKPVVLQTADEESTEPQESSEYATNLSNRSLHILRHVIGKTDRIHYERRMGQESMTKKVAQALVDDVHLVIEAGTGTGKSIAYLLPSVLFAKSHGERVVVSTHTIALQEQLYRQDLRVIEESLPFAFRAAVLKGRTHYLCLRKAAQYSRTLIGLPVAERDFMLSLMVWLTQTVAGDRAEIAMSGKEQEYWSNVQSETESCIGRRCTFFRDCYYFRARQSASEAYLVITNHSLVLSDLKADHRVLPPYQYLIIDEAHQLEDQATKQLGAEVSEDECRRLIDRLTSRNMGQLGDIARELNHLAVQGHTELYPYSLVFDRMARVIVEIGTISQELFLQLKRFMEQHAGGRQEKRIDATVMDTPAFAILNPVMEKLATAHALLGKAVADYDRLITEIEVADNFFGRMEDALGRVRSLLNVSLIIMDVLYHQRQDGQLVGWVAVRPERSRVQVSLHLAPLVVAEVLKKELFEAKSAIIMTSATLSVAGSFSYFLDQVGLSELYRDERVSTCRVESPFSYKEQTLLCIPNDLPDTKDTQAFATSVGHSIMTIATAARGRTLVLFTANQMLTSVYYAQRDLLQKVGIRVLAQGLDDHRKSRLIDTFRAEERAVLFGVSSFWEGIDIPGEDLSCLIIVKLPFAVPTHPVTEARCDILTKQGRNPFREYSVPQAVIRFTQGFGRLIRSRSDRGVVFVLDKRVITTSYGGLFLRSLPGPQVLVGSLKKTEAAAIAFFSHENHTLDEGCSASESE